LLGVGPMEMIWRDNADSIRSLLLQHSIDIRISSGNNGQFPTKGFDAIGISITDYQPFDG
jgi:hypothetical protein